MDPGPLPVQVRTLILLVVAARKAGTDPTTAVQAVARPAPSPEAVAAVVDLLDALGPPGMPARVIFERIEGVPPGST